jgi:hypothetical protein
MLFYIRNTTGSAYADTFLGLEIPAKATTNEGIFAIDSNSLEGLLRVGSNLNLIFTTGTDGSVSYGSSGIYVSEDGTAGENKADIGAAGADAEEKALIAYRKIREAEASKIYFDGSGTNYATTDTDVATALASIDTQLSTVSGLSDTLVWRPSVEFITEDSTFDAAGPLTIASITTPLSDDEAPITYNNPAVNVVITDGDLATAIAANIRAETFPGWVVSGTGADVVFTSTIYGALPGTNSFTLNTTTGVTGNFVITTSGSNGVSEEITLTISGTASGTGSVDINLRNTVLTDALVTGKYVLYKGTTGANSSLWKSNGTSLVKQTSSEGLVDGYAWIVKSDFIDSPASAENQSLYVFSDVSGLVKISDVDWGEISLQEAYNGGATITVVGGTPFVVGPNGISVSLATGITTTKIGQTGGVTVTDTGTASAATLTFKDGNLTAAVPISESGVTGLSGTFTATSIVGAINENHSDIGTVAGDLSTLSGIVSGHTTFINSLDDTTDGASGADQIGVTAIPGIAGGVDTTVQAALESVGTQLQNASGKHYADISAFTTAKAVSGDIPFVAGEVVYINDSNRFVEVLTANDNIVENTDWSYVGGSANAIGGANFVIDTTTTVNVTSADVNITADTGSVDVLAAAGASVTATTLDVSIQALDGNVSIDGTSSVNILSDGDTCLTLESNSGNPTVTVDELAAFILPTGTTATGAGIEGAVKYDTTTGLAYTYTGSEWLSVSRTNIQYGAVTTDGQYLTIGGVSSGQTGWLATRNCKIKALAIKIGAGNLTKPFEIRKDGTIVGTAFTPTAGVVSTVTLNLSVTAGEYIQIFSSADGQKSDNVVAAIELAYVG